MGIQKGGIAFFDSGIGGLTVMAACESYFPGGVFYYYGDNVHAPYGNLAPKKIERYVFRALKKFRRFRSLLGENLFENLLQFEFFYCIIVFVKL